MTTWVYGRDLRAGDRFELAEHVVTEESIVNFAREWDPQSFHMNSETAAASRFGGLIASGIQTVGVFQRLAVLGHWQSWKIIAGRGIRDLQFRRPVRPGDALSGWFVVESVSTAASFGDVVTIAATVQNQQSSTVMTLTMEIQMESAPPEGK